MPSQCIQKERINYNPCVYYTIPCLATDTRRSGQGDPIFNMETVVKVVSLDCTYTINFVVSLYIPSYLASFSRATEHVEDSIDVIGYMESGN